MGADCSFGQRNTAFDVFAVYRTVIAAVRAAGAIIAEDKILVLAEDKRTGKLNGKGIDLFGKIRLDEHFAVNKDVAVLDVDEFAGETDDAFDGTFFVAIVEDDDVAALDRSGDRGGVNPSVGFVSRKHAGAANKGNGANKGVGHGNTDTGGDKNGKDHPEEGSFPKV